jgi:hypothetical protein
MAGYLLSARPSSQYSNLVLLRHRPRSISLWQARPQRHGFQEYRLTDPRPLRMGMGSASERFCFSCKKN